MTHSPGVANSFQDISFGNQIPPIEDELAYLTNDEVSSPQNLTQNFDPDTDYDKRPSAENAALDAEESSVRHWKKRCHVDWSA